MSENNFAPQPIDQLTDGHVVVLIGQFFFLKP